MAAEERFYRAEDLCCPLCHATLTLFSRIAQPDSMALIHEENNCKRSGRVYYCPGIDLTPMPKEFQ
jgi:hypothetical protein